MFKDLFDSKLKKKLLSIFFAFPKRSFHQQELAEMTRIGKGALARCLRELQAGGVVDQMAKRRNRYYRLNGYFPFREELETLLSDQKYGHDDPASQTMKKIENAKLVILTGVFSFQPQMEVDALIVGQNINRPRLEKAVADLGRLAGQEVHYALMDLPEFNHRKSMSDRFIRDVLDFPHIVVVNGLKSKNVLH